MFLSIIDQEDSLDRRAFFFLNDSLLLPADVSDSQISEGLPLELSKEFDNPDIFEIPDVNEPLSMITAVSVSPTAIVPSAWRTIPVRRILALFGGANDGETKRVLRACHITQWRRDSCYCGTCGTKNNDVPFQAQRVCPKCGRLEFPRICPAVIVIITDDENRILLAHNKRFKDRVYSLIAGFNEAGETLEESAVREIREEVNIEVKDIVYIKSQSWPFPNSLMIGFSARYSSGIIKPDGEEIEDAKWFTKDDLPELPAEGSLSRYLINNWINRNF